MGRFAHSTTRLLLVTGLALSGLFLASSTASAATVSINLCALPGTLAPLPSTAPGVSIPIWGFGIPSTPGDCTTATASLPGPLLSVDQGDTVTINVTNALPAGHTISLEAPGIAFDAGPSDAAVGAMVSRTFTAGAPGTYLYQSAGDAGRQEAMGLYGALIIRPATAGQAYGSATTAFDVEAPLVLSQVDPAFNADPDNFDLHVYRATYWLINGLSYPDTAPISAAVGQRLLVRYLNAGYDNTTMLVLGMHERVLARDASLLNNPFDADAETIPAGATEDVIATIPAGAPASANGFALYNRQLHVENGPAGDPNHTPGGMLTFIQP
jgi:FtsP/CotA-like multicopper oxidase with cupredoxin domain